MFHNVKRGRIYMKNSILNYTKAMNWVEKNSLDDCGIAVTSKEQKIYPEVTGYYIPSLLQWGEREKACLYAEYLCSIQKKDGSWYDFDDKAPYVFDSAQILKGLLAIRKIMPSVDKNIIKGCDWIISNMQSDGRLTTPSKDAWGENENFCSELIHIYCLSPIREAGVLFNNSKYLEAASKILAYYKREKLDRITEFSLLSHFYAYVMEGLYDLGEIELCQESMLKLEKYRNKKNGIPGLKNVSWVCSTGMFQLAVVWYKLKNLERGDSLFKYALSLQNESGGWYGSYPMRKWPAFFYGRGQRPYYFPDEEISWAVKYFFDALALREKLIFEKQASIFQEEISKDDGRYLFIRKILMEASNTNRTLKVCDIGCGKGRYLKKLMLECPTNKYYAMDLSMNVMEGIFGVEEKRQGSLTNISYEDESFDIVYVCEAFEHAINLRGAFKELYRVIKKGGKMVIIDKPIEKMGSLKIDEWEQWISDDDIRKFTEECGGELEIETSIPYENKNDGLFRGWVVTKK